MNIMTDAIWKSLTVEEKLDIIRHEIFQDAPDLYNHDSDAVKEWQEILASFYRREHVHND